MTTYTDDSSIEVRFPKDKAEEQGPRENWSWLPGVIVSSCEDEYQVLVEDERLGIIEGGEMTYPLCFRDASEIRPFTRGRLSQKNVGLLDGAVRISLL